MKLEKSNLLINNVGISFSLISQDLSFILAREDTELIFANKSCFGYKDWQIDYYQIVYFHNGEIRELPVHTKNMNYKGKKVWWYKKGEISEFYREFYENAHLDFIEKVLKRLNT